MKARYFVLAGLLVVVAGGAGAFFYLQQKQKPASLVTIRAPAPPPAAVKPAAPPAPAQQAPADCLLPGPPPVPPNGFTATDADMKLGHDVIQAFVLRLEAFQACRNAMADQAPTGTTEERKRIWIEEGNAAVDEAHAMADAFSAQLKNFHARHK